MITYRPGAPLDRVVERIWWSERTRPSDACEHHLPSGRPHLVIALHDEPISWSAVRGGDVRTWTRGVVHGPQSSYYVAGPKPRGIVIGASFQPGMAPFVFGVAASELTGLHVPFDDVWGSSGRVLRERLAAAATPRAALAVFEAALASRLRTTPSLHVAVTHALDAFEDGVPPPRVAAIRRETGYSARHFVALFRAATGLTPKEYARIVRFGTVLRALADGRSDAGTLAELAAASGYADQSHLTREFRDLAGTTPARYRPPAPASAHHHLAGDALRDGPR